VAPGAGRVEVEVGPGAHRALEPRVLAVLEHALGVLADSIEMAGVGARAVPDAPAWVARLSEPT
jgi:hypothetical protein